jgi:hypothetical protein
MRATKKVGVNFLHNHPGMENKKNIGCNHVIVDREDWENIVEFFQNNPELVEKLNKSI